MQSPSILTLAILPLAALGLAHPSPAPRTACANPSFILTNPLFEEWGMGKYAQILNGAPIGQSGPFVSEFLTNTTSAAQTYFIESSTGRWFFKDSTGNKYFAYSDEFEEPSVRFDLLKNIPGDDSRAVTVFCGVPKKNGDTFVCRGNNDTRFEQFDVTYGNQGEPISLIGGNATGPYPKPNPNQEEFAYEGGVRIEVQGLGCSK
ncbi:hypothetical protein PRZ48_012994 [Zasmidium cellare]|uniref:Uncharacterized protein n=1 Tax=Zasmidium cellare TaxID=395010 RepID=A0ABR0E3C4_ZASCE|nr:hypothetical protein PRZ48_012994 [Zasmidium cellare]